MRRGAGFDGRRGLLWLAVVCACLLVGTLALEYHSAVMRETHLAPPNQAAAARTLPARQPVPGGDATAVAGVDDWTRIALARPIFSPSRRPAAIAATGPRQPRLTGIVIGPAGARAIFAGENDGRGVVAAVGQQAGDWRVLAIDAASVHVSGPDGLHTLHPLRDANAHADDASSSLSVLPAHPSILDLLRSRPMQVSPNDGSMAMPGLRLPPPSPP